MRKIKNGNIFTVMIADKLGLTDEVALRVHDRMDEMNYVDWSEAEEDEIYIYAMLAFQDLNESYPVDF